MECFSTDFLKRGASERWTSLTCGEEKDKNMFLKYYYTPNVFVTHSEEVKATYNTHTHKDLYF